GRNDLRSRLGQLLRERRIVSVVGPAGTGKTRLVLEVGGDLLPFFRDGVWRIDLRSAGDLDAVARACAEALGVAEERDRDLLDSVASFLETRAALLILDACERAGGAAARAAAVLTSAPEVRVLATSREPLQVTGEQTLRLGPLATRAERGGLSEAAHLLVERIRARDPGQAIDDDRATAIDAICASLDGSPLALELVAPRVRALPLQSIARQLENRFRALSERAGDGRARLQMLRETLEWSLELLAPAERRLFERLSQFAEGLERSAALAVCAGEGLEAGEIPLLLGPLLDASLVDELADASDGGSSRYVVSRALREFAAEMRRPGDQSQVQQRFLEWALALAENAADGSPEGMGRLLREQDNLEAALETGHRLELHEPVARLTAALTPFWIRRGRWREGLAWAERAERLAPLDRRVRAPLLIALGALLRASDPTRAEGVLREGLALAVQSDDRVLPIEALHQLAALARDRGDFAGTESLLREQIAQLGELDDPLRRFRAETELATLLLQDGRAEQAVAALRMRLAEAETRGWRFDRARLSNNLAVGLIELGQHAEALRMASAGADLFRELGSLEGVAHLMSTAGLALMRGGDPMQARRHFIEVGRIALEVGASPLAPEALDRLAALEIEDGRERAGARYLYAADALYARIGHERERADRALRESLQVRLDARLDADTLARIQVDAMMQARNVLSEAVGTST
ncbi:MAG: transcriptional regulator, LuxR family, partial [Panacagrimonas sp.]